MHIYTERILGLIGERDPLDSMARTPGRLADLYARIGEKGIEQSYDAGKWTARKIFAHLADAELAIGFRIRQVLAGERQIQVFDQDIWASRYDSADTWLAVEAETALRQWNLGLFRSLGPPELRRAALHPERGEETVGLMIRLMAGHDLNHLGQLEKIAKAG